ncbi:MAG: DNA-3-methyladenine glycosylase 2 family protein [Lewinellaceae bacterium]|nr:DNA-3-methyladenine glycosylase 2 family protein [Saprospiraceae bacterium]MCB9336891.1 DNA-3-methyladenine glycosylase 2 family protein [Lewinellaceae bacterium]
MTQPIIHHLSANDEVLQRIIAQLPLPKFRSTKNVFHDLMSCLIEQQIHYRSSKRIFQKMMDAAGIEMLTVENFSTLEKKGFQNIKLSAQKYETMLQVVEFFDQNKVDWAQKTDAEVREILSEIKGVGIWTMDMILLYTLERPDVFPADDYHLKMMMTKLYGLASSAKLKAQMNSVAEAWSPYKSFAVRYLLTWKEFRKNEKT